MKETTKEEELVLREETKSSYYYYMPKEEFEIIKANRQKEQSFNLIYGFLLSFGGKYVVKNFENGVKALLKGAKSGDAGSVAILKIIIAENKDTSKLLEKEKEWVLSQ